MTRFASHKRRQFVPDSPPPPLEPLETETDDLQSLTACLNDLTRIQVRMQATLEHILASLVTSAKQRKLEWALINSSIGAFDYYEEDGNLKSSKGRVEEVLISFMGHGGRFVNTGSMEPTGDEAGKKAFRQKLHDQISRMLGVPCRLEMVDDKVTLWYA